MHETARIQALNDALRTELWRWNVDDNNVVVTSGVQALGDDFIIRARLAVRAFDDFTEDNDPWGEHDFGSFAIDGQKLFWKIDYYDRDLKFGSEDPTDPAVTRRVLTILLASEY